jgi:hypothetical protein
MREVTVRVLGRALAPPSALARATAWAVRARYRAYRSIRRGDVIDNQVPPAPALGQGARPAVTSVLLLTGSRCLSRSLVMQRWHEAQGDAYDVVIGVTPPSAGFKAHAWLEPRDEEAPDNGFTEIRRISARATT